MGYGALVESPSMCVCREGEVPTERVKDSVVVRDCAHMVLEVGVKTATVLSRDSWEPVKGELLF